MNADRRSEPPRDAGVVDHDSVGVEGDARREAAIGGLVAHDVVAGRPN